MAMVLPTFLRHINPRKRRAGGFGFVAGLGFMMLISSRSQSQISDEQAQQVKRMMTDYFAAVSGSVQHLSVAEVHKQLKQALSPANQRGFCYSLLHPGGQCQCKDAEEGNMDECLMVPVMDGKKPVCMDLLPAPGQPCLIYTFGIRDDLSFENEMARYGCTVHAFDPTVRLNGTRLGHENRLHVHYIGLDGTSWVYKNGEHDFQLLTLDDIVGQLGHQHARIDYIKVDVEGSEWSFLRQQLTGGAVLRNIAQVNVEFHLMLPHGMLSGDNQWRHELSLEDGRNFLQSIRALEAAGYSMVEINADLTQFKNAPISFIYETTWIRRD